MDNPFRWGYQTTVPGPNDVFGPFALAYLILFGVGFLVALFLYNDGARRYTDHPLKRRVARRGGAIASAVFGVGLFFFGIRILQINPFTFGMRLWLSLSLLAVLIMLAYFAYYLRTTFRAELRDFEKRQIRRRYLRPTAAAAGARVAAFPEPRRPTRRRRK